MLSPITIPTPSAFPFLILGQSVARTGSYNTGWVIFAVMALIGAALFYFTNLDPKQDPIELEKK